MENIIDSYSILFLLLSFGTLFLYFNLVILPIKKIKGKRMNKKLYAAICAASLIVWGILYLSILPLAQWITYDFLDLARDTPVGTALEFFLYDTTKILLLLILMVYIISWLRAGMNVERVRDYLSDKGRMLGYLSGAVFGAITPFCSCSSIPIFIGFTMAHIPIGITMSFLITSPLINEVAVVLLWGLLGLKFTAMYILVGLLAGILSGIFIDAIHAERWLQPCAQDAMKNSMKPLTIGHTDATRQIDLKTRHIFAWNATINILRKIRFWVIIGVGLGSIMHGYIPQEWFTEHMNSHSWWSVPIAVTIGIPLYTNATGIIPIMESLLLKGLPLGTTLAFCMSTVAVSLPEILMLRQVLRWQLLTVFLGLLLFIFTLTGWLFNILQNYIF
jgi:hypothetical protein